MVRIGAVPVAILLAWVTYRLIERPLRAGLGGGAAPTLLLASMAAMGVLGYATFAAGGLPSRPVAIANRDNAALLGWDFFHTPDCDRAWDPSMTFCLGFGRVDAPRVVVLGDSTANALASMVPPTQKPSVLIFSTLLITRTVLVLQNLG